MTSLAQQLASVARKSQNWPQPSVATAAGRKKPSLLFNEQAASDVDGHTLYSIGCEGLASLSKIEPRFTSFRSSLFSQASIDFVRDHQTLDVLEKLDETLGSFFDLLAEHFLSPGCFKALEYLIRKYKINEHNVHALLSMSLPYHSTNEFVRLVQTLTLSAQGGHSLKSCWGWLSRMQESGAHLPRGILVQRCLNDKAVLRALCEGAKRMGQKRGSASSPTYLSFYAVVLCEVVDSVGAVGDEMLEQLLPYLVEGLEPTSSNDYRAATLMVFAEICTKASLSQTFLSAILISTVTGMEAGSKEHLRTVLLVLSHAASTQSHLDKIPLAALEGLLSSPLLIEELSYLSQARARIDPLMDLLTLGLLERMTQANAGGGVDSAPSFKLLQSILFEGFARGALAEKLTSCILIAAPLVPESEPSDLEPVAGKRAKKPAAHLVSGASEISQLRSWLVQLLRTTERRAPEAVDAAVNSFLGAGRSQSKTTRKMEEDEEDSDVDEQPAACGSLSTSSQLSIYKIIVEAFSGTSHAPCGDTGFTVEAAIRAPQAGLRKAAMIHASQMLDLAPQSSDPEAIEARSRLGNCLVSGLGDDDWSVVHSALEATRLDTAVHSSALLPSLQALLQRAFKSLVMPKGVDSSDESSGSAVAISLLMKTLTLLQDKGKHDVTVRDQARDLALMLFLSLSIAPVQALSTVGDVVASRLSLLPVSGCSLSQALRKMADLDHLELLKPFPSNLPKSEKKAWKEEKKEKKIALLFNFRRNLVDAVASSVSSPASLESILRLAGRASIVDLETSPLGRSSMQTAVLHTILLSLHTRLVKPNFDLSAQGKVNGKDSKKAGGKKQANAEAPAAQEIAITAALSSEVSASLLDFCFSEIELLSRQKEEGVFDDWVEQSSIFVSSNTAEVDSFPRPTAEHVRHAHSSLEKVHSASLCFALHSALVAEFKSLPHENPLEALKLAQHRFNQVSHLPASFHQHLSSIAHVAFPQLPSRCSFLGQVYSSSNSHVSARVAALRLHAQTLAHIPGPSSLDEHGVGSWLGYVLSAASDANVTVRKEAVSLLSAIGSLHLSSLSATCAALAGQGALVVSDADAARALIARLISSAASEAPGPIVTPTPSKAKGKNTPATDSSAAAQNNDSFPPGATLESLFISSLPQPQPSQSMSSADLNSVRILLSCLIGDTQRDDQGALKPQLKSSCLNILSSLSSSSTERDFLDDDSSLHLARLLVLVLSTSLEAPSSKVLSQLLTSPNDSEMRQNATHYDAYLRRAAFGSFGSSPGLLSSLMSHSPSSSQVLVAFVAASSSDPCEHCRRSARLALESVEISGALLEPLILKGLSRASLATNPQAPPSAKKKKVVAAPADSAMSHEVDAAGLNLSIHVLELLQWKKLAGGVEVAISAAQSLLDSLLPLIGSISVHHDDADKNDLDPEASRDVSQPVQSSLAGYAAQLALAAIEVAATEAFSLGKAEADSLAKVLRPEIVVKAAQDAPDIAIRNSALSLLAVEARLMPELVLGHVLQVLSVIHHSVLVQEDQHSRQVATSAMQALVPAWLGAGRPAQGLWEAIVKALPKVAAPRRLHLLSSLLAAMPQSSGMPTALVLLVEKASIQADQAANNLALGVEADDGKRGEVEADDDMWLPLATQLIASVDVVQRIQALSSLLAQSVEMSQGGSTLPLPRMTIAFATTQLLKAKASKDSGSSQPSPDLQPACELLMNQALAQVQALTLPIEQQLSALEHSTPSKGGPSAADKKPKGGSKLAEDPSTASKKKALQRSCKASLEGLYSLMEALQGLMSSESYLRALAALAENPSDKLQRRVLKIFAEKVKGLKLELESLSGLTAQEQKVQEDKLSQAALLPCEMLARAAAGGGSSNGGGSSKSALSIQALLVAAGASMSLFGRLKPDSVISSLPSVLKFAESADWEEGASAVRGSALIAVAAASRAVGSRLVPLLPTAIRVTLQSGKGASSKLDLDPGGGGGGGGQTVDDESVSVELASSLVSLSALVESQGAFLSPYLKEILALLLDPRVLACSSGGCSKLAADARASLPPVVPARLLLEPTFGALTSCIAGGAEPTLALLTLVRSSVEGMDSKTAASFCESVFSFLLRALDVRTHVPPSLASGNGVQLVESAAVATLVALVMKLTESRFKPLFLRMLEWATTQADGFDLGGGGEAGGSSGTVTARPSVLFAVTAALTERLRSVFVPYYRYLIDHAIRHLSLSGASTQPRKKQKKQATEGGLTSSEEGWVLRVRVLQALHLALLHDAGGFFDSDKLTRLLDPLVSQLTIEAPRPDTLVIEQQCRAEGKVSSFDIAGSVAITCLVQMAITSNSDTFWKPLNHRVLMLTRNGSVRTRLLALEVVLSLILRLREEFLVLLPETIPFLSELLEDIKDSVSNKAQQVIATLEEIGGESLNEYLKRG